MTLTIYQTTLRNHISCSGIGLHSGVHTTMTVFPAPADTGILFKRRNVPSTHAYIPARYDAVCETRLGTTIGNRHGTTVATIEHLMAALWGVGIDNAVIELDGPEVPIMDGSSEPFVFMLECAGIVQTATPRRVLRVLKPIEIWEGNSMARVEPHENAEDGCAIDLEIDFAQSIIRHQAAYYDFRDVSFKQSLSRARTFGFEHEVAALRESGLALGGSLDNAIIVGKDRILNEEGLRYDDEFVRHKALDCLGDLYLAGYRIDGKFTFLRPGHAINNALLQALFNDESAYILAEAGRPIANPFPYLPLPVTAYA